MIAASSDIGDFFGDVGRSVVDELKKAGQDAVTHIREDLADAAAKLGAGAGMAAGGVLAPAGRKPVVIPLTSKQVGYLAVVLVLLLLGAGYLVSRARR